MRKDRSSAQKSFSQKRREEKSQKEEGDEEPVAAGEMGVQPKRERIRSRNDPQGKALHAATHPRQENPSLEEKAQASRKKKGEWQQKWRPPAENLGDGEQAKGKNRRVLRTKSALI